MGSQVTTMDSELYEEYKPIREQYEFAESFCRWYENGGKRDQVIPEYKIRLKRRLIALKGFMSHSQIYSAIGVTPRTISYLTNGKNTAISEELAEQAIAKADEIITPLKESNKQIQENRTVKENLTVDHTGISNDLYATPNIPDEAPF